MSAPSKDESDPATAGPSQGLPHGDGPIPPLRAETYVERLTSSTGALRALRALREAMVDQHPEYAREFPERPRGAARDGYPSG